MASCPSGQVGCLALSGRKGVRGNWSEPLGVLNKTLEPEML